MAQQPQKQVSMKTVAKVISEVSKPPDRASIKALPSVRKIETELKIDVEKLAKIEKQKQYIEDEKAKVEELEQIKEAMDSAQMTYFTNVQNSLNSVDVLLADKTLNQIQDKVTKSIEAEIMEINQRNKLAQSKTSKKILEQEELQNSLENLSKEISQIRLQKSENPLSNFSQPRLQVESKGEILKKQLEASEFVNVVHDTIDKERKEVRKKRKLQALRRKELEKQRQEESNKRRMQLKKQRKDQVKKHIQEINERSRNRLKNMMAQEGQYFKNLDKKLQTLEQQREHLKGLKLEKSVMLTGVKPMVIKDPLEEKVRLKKERREKYRALAKEIAGQASAKQPIKENLDKSKISNKKIKKDKKPKPVIENIQIEKPLFSRMNKDFQEKLKNDEIIAAKEFSKKLKHFKKYDVIDFSLHEVQYKRRKQQMIEKMRSERYEKLKSLGLEPGKISSKPKVSFNSKLWMVSDPSSLYQNNTLEQLKLKRLKVKSYVDKISQSVDITVDEGKQTELEVRIDKLNQPKKYIKMLKRKRPGSVELDDVEIYSIEKPELHPKEAQQIGLSYLSELPNMIQVLKSDMKKDPEKFKHPMMDQVKLSLSASMISPKGFDSAKHQNFLDEVRQTLKLDEAISRRESVERFLMTPQYTTNKISLPPITVQLQREKKKIIKDIEKSDDEYIRKKLLIEERRKSHLMKVSGVLSRIKSEKTELQIDSQKLEEVAKRLQKRSEQIKENISYKWALDPIKVINIEDQSDNKLVDSLQVRLKAIELSKKSVTTHI